MQLHHGIEGLKSLPPGCVLSVGNYDGIHRGHRSILQFAKTLKPAAPLAIVTFEPHPLTVLRPQSAPPRLTPFPLKELMLQQLGVDHLVVLAPTPEVLNLSAEEFWRILQDDVRPAHLIEGESFTFGKGRSGTVDRLRQWSAGGSIKLHIVEPVRVALLDLHIVSISSSLIRWLIAHGRVRDAAICLSQPYILKGSVIKGHQRGRELGMPTANLDCADQLIPTDGVYIGRCQVDGKQYPAAVSVGTMPTFGENKRQVEAHLIGFNGDLYGATIQLQLLDWLRDQWKFSQVDALVKRMQADIDQVNVRSRQSFSEPIALVD